MLIKGFKCNISIYDDSQKGEILDELDDLRRRMSRIVACYLSYRYEAEDQFLNACNAFGITVEKFTRDNPLVYAVAYIVTLILSVYMGVYASAVAFDYHAGLGMTGQDLSLIGRWILLSLANYGLAITTILTLKVIYWYRSTDVPTIFVYCWSFVIAAIIGPAGLASVLIYWHPERNIIDTFIAKLPWGVGPGLLAVFILYYLDRQTYSKYQTLRNRSKSIIMNFAIAIMFSLITLVLLLPPLMSIRAPEGSPWTTEKLQVVAAGTTALVTLSMALVAQFGLEKCASSAKHTGSWNSAGSG